MSPDVASLTADPSARVMVFVDGQNLYKGCKRIFGHPLCYPHLLAEHLAGSRTTHQVACRFYTGRPNPNVPGERRKTRNLDRRLHAMRAAGITVVTRPLRYHWDWGHQEHLPKPSPDERPRKVTLRPWQRPQEKGIDSAIALDVVEFALLDKFDVAIVVSLDRDLREIPLTIRRLAGFLNRPVRLEAAVPVPDGSHSKTLSGFHYTHQITQEVFELVKDRTDYTAHEGLWVPPTWPISLQELSQ